MSEDRIREQAEAIAAALPGLMRQLFTLEARDPARDLPVGQLRVCALLQDGPRSMTSLSRELRISVSAITQIADRLERARIVDRVPDPCDRRVRGLRLTAHGVRIMRRRQQGRIERIEEALRAMAPRARGEVVAAMRALLNAAAATAPAQRGDAHSDEDRPVVRGDRDTRKDSR
jgi:DNA-binding MarR family transcriptional regulator